MDSVEELRQIVREEVRRFRSVELPESGNGQMIIHLPEGAEAREAVHIEVRSGEQRQVVLQLGNGVVIRLQDEGKAIQIDVGQGAATISISQDGNIAIGAKGSIDISGSTINLAASGNLKLTGAVVAIN